MHVCRTATSVAILTPAKINLFLEVLGKRADGYHEIETLLAAVTLYDSLLFTPTERGEMELIVRWGAGLDSAPAARELLYGQIPNGPKNLVWRAAALVRGRSGVKRGVKIELVKRIPAAAGLGGASSDAAATLVAANEAWQLGWPRERLAALAAELGSDVPFFLSRGMAVCRGRGEHIETVPERRMNVVVVRPPVGLSTSMVYTNCRPVEQPAGIHGMIAALARGDSAEVGKHLVNSLQPAASGLTPWIETVQTALTKQGILGHQMSGSGSSCFAICRSARHARRVAARLRSMRLGAVLAATTAVAT